MRTKTTARRQAILETAAETFRERGFDATSMSEVAARLGGSKATLYNYFRSKEQLFAEVMLEQVRAQGRPLVESLVTSENFTEALRRMAPAYLRFVLQPDVMAIGRMCIAEGERCGFGREVYEEGPKPAWLQLAARIKQAMDEGELRQAEPLRAWMHLKALIESELVDPRMRGWRGPPTDQEIEDSAKAAVEAFLRAYAP